MVGVVSRATLLYDDGCRLCRFAARCVARLDRSKQVALLGLRDEAADPLLAVIPREERLATVRLLLPDGRLLSAGHAALETLVLLARNQRFEEMVGALHAEEAAEVVYRLVARHRQLLGRLVPDGSAPRRFP